MNRTYLPYEHRPMHPVRRFILSYDGILVALAILALIAVSILGN